MDHGGSVQWDLDLSHGRNAATVQDSESISPYTEGDTKGFSLSSPLQSPANEPNLKVKKCFEAELGPAFLDRSGQERVKGGILKTQRIPSSEPFLIVLDQQMPS